MKIMIQEGRGCLYYLFTFAKWGLFLLFVKNALEWLQLKIPGSYSVNFDSARVNFVPLIISLGI